MFVGGNTNKHQWNGLRMKNFRVVVMISLIFLLACTPAADDRFTEFSKPDPEIYVELMPVIREYFYYRKQAVLKSEMDVLYDRYPALETDINIDQGINIEASQVHHMQSLAPFDGDIFPEYYEKIRVWEEEDEVQFLVHGMALYLFMNPEGLFSESEGEFMMVIYAKYQGGNWQISKTDEVTLGEWKDKM